MQNGGRRAHTQHVWYAAPSISQMLLSHKWINIFFFYFYFGFAIEHLFSNLFHHISTEYAIFFLILCITYAVSGIFKTIFLDDKSYFKRENDFYSLQTRSALATRTFKLKSSRMVYCVSNHVFFSSFTRFSFCLCSCTVYAQCTRDPSNTAMFATFSKFDRMCRTTTFCKY